MAQGIKTGGRTAGTPNKTTSDIKAKLVALFTNNLKTFEADLKALEPKDRVAANFKLLEYVVPKQRDSILDDVPVAPREMITEEESRIFYEQFRHKYKSDPELEDQIEHEAHANQKVMAKIKAQVRADFEREIRAEHEAANPLQPSQRTLSSNLASFVTEATR